MRTTAPGQASLLLLDVAAVLRGQSIDYAVIGAMAAAAHGVVRASIDADAVLSLTVREAARLHDVFAAAGFHAELRRGDADDPIPALLELKDDCGNRVDLLIGLRGLKPDAFARALTVPFGGEGIRVVSREDFIAMKLFAGGPQDLLDAGNVHDVDPLSLDMELLRRLAADYGPDVLEKLENLIAPP